MGTVSADSPSNIHTLNFHVFRVSLLPPEPSSCGQMDFSYFKCKGQVSVIFRYGVHLTKFHGTGRQISSRMAKVSQSSYHLEFPQSGKSWGAVQLLESRFCDSCSRQVNPWKVKAPRLHMSMLIHQMSYQALQITLSTNKVLGTQRAERGSLQGQCFPLQQASPVSPFPHLVLSRSATGEGAATLDSLWICSICLFHPILPNSLIGESGSD